MANIFNPDKHPKFLNQDGVGHLWEKIRERFDPKLDRVEPKDESIEILNGNIIGVRLSEKGGNIITLVTDQGEEGIYAPTPEKQDLYTITKKDVPNDGAAASYKLQKQKNGIGDMQDIDGSATIDIPDYLTVSSGFVETKSTSGEWGEPGTYLHLILENTTGQNSIFINVDSLIEYIISGSEDGDMIYVHVDDQHRVTATITNGTVTEEKFTAEVQEKLDSAYEHASMGGTGFTSGLYKISTNANGHITSAVAVTKNDITALGIPGSVPTKVSDLQNDAGYITTETDPSVPAWAKAKTKPTYTPEEIGLGNVANERQYSESNPPPSDETKQDKIEVSGILKGDGEGGVSAAVEGTDYINGDIIAVQDEMPTDPNTQIWLPETQPESVSVPSYAEFLALSQNMAARVAKPESAPDGTSGQVLMTNGDGTTQWTDMQMVTDAQAIEAVSDWLDNHPAATTTVDFSISTKVFPNVSGMISDTTLTEGDNVATRGYYTSGDNGGFNYVISATHHGVFYITLDNGLYANRLTEDDFINVNTIGIKCYNTKANALADNATMVSNYEIAQAAIDANFSLVFCKGWYAFSESLSIKTETNIIGYKRELTSLLFPNSIGLNFNRHIEYHYQVFREFRIISLENCINIDVTVYNVINCRFERLWLVSDEGECIVAPPNNNGARGANDTCVWSCVFSHIHAESKVGAMFANIKGLGNWFYFILMLGKTRIAFRNCTGTFIRLDTGCEHAETCFYYDDARDYSLHLNLKEVHFEACEKSFIFSEDSTMSTMALGVYAVDSGITRPQMVNSDIPFIKVGRLLYLYHYGQYNMLPSESYFNMEALHGAIIHTLAPEMTYAKNFRTNLGGDKGLKVWAGVKLYRYFDGGRTSTVYQYYYDDDEAIAKYGALGIDRMYGGRSHQRLVITDDMMPENTENIVVKKIDPAYEFCDCIEFRLTADTDQTTIKKIQLGNAWPGRILTVINSSTSTKNILMKAYAKTGDNSEYCLAADENLILAPGDSIVVTMGHFGPSKYLRWFPLQNESVYYVKPSGGIPASDLAESYIEEPSAAGISGQVLGLDSNLNPVWVNQQGGGGGGGTSDYTDLTNKPQINSVTLSGNKSLSELGIASADDLAAKYTKPISGIPASDLADGVVPDISGKADKTDTVLNTTISRGRKENSTIGQGSFAFGRDVEAGGAYSHAEGFLTNASGTMSHAEGDHSIASGTTSHAEGDHSIASGYSSHAEGYSISSGFTSHAEGSYATASGDGAHAEGTNTIAAGNFSHVFGAFNIQDSNLEWPNWVSGATYNIGDRITVAITEEDPVTGDTRTDEFRYICEVANSDINFDSSKWKQIFSEISGLYIEIAGNGDYINRSNARALDWDGNEYLKGDLYVGANADSTGGTKVATVSDISGKVDKSAIDNAGITAKSYTQLFGGQFSVTTVQTQGYNNPFAEASVIGQTFSKYHMHRVTINNNEYVLRTGLWFHQTSSGFKVYTFIGNISLLIDDTTGYTDEIYNVPFIITFDYNDGKVNVLTSTAGTYNILIEKITLTQEELPLSLVYGDSYNPIQIKKNTGTYQGTSIGTNELSNSRGTIAIGNANSISDDFSIAIGNGNTISNEQAVAIGFKNTVSGLSAVAEGIENTASGAGSHAEGNGTTASGGNSHSEGNQTTASGAMGSHSEGFNTNATGMMSHAEGAMSTAGGTASHAEGQGTNASSSAQHAQGKYNVEDVNGVYADIVGNGSSSNAKSNAFALTWTGDGKFAGNVYANCNDDSSGGTMLSKNSDIAYVETSLVAQRAYIPGDYFVDPSGILSKATDSISAGGSLVLDTNYERIGGQGGLANDMLAKAELVGEVTLTGDDVPAGSGVVSVPLSKPCRHLVIHVTNGGQNLPGWSYIRLNYGTSKPAVQVYSSGNYKRAMIIIDLKNKYGFSIAKSTSDDYPATSVCGISSNSYIISNDYATEIGFCANSNYQDGFNIKVYGR